MQHWGSWGGGIAAILEPNSPSQLRLFQLLPQQQNLLGKSLLLKADDFDESKIYIACLFTSDFSQTPEQIASYTYKSLEDLATQMKSVPDVELNGVKKVINMPKINAGIFWCSLGIDGG